jgi:hypothetical protein
VIIIPKLLALHGSPRKKGNTELLLDAALEAAQSAGAEVEKVRLPTLNFEPCRSCGGCDKTGKCIVKDDMQGLYPKLIEFDRFIIASPVYFKSITAQTKAFIDRTQCLWVAKYVLKEAPWRVPPVRHGAFISTCGSDNPDMFGPSVSIIKSFYAVLDIRYEFDLLIEGVDDKGEVGVHPDYLEKAKDLGKNLVELE